MEKMHIYSTKTDTNVRSLSPVMLCFLSLYKLGLVFEQFGVLAAVGDGESVLWPSASKASLDKTLTIFWADGVTAEMEDWSLFVFLIY